jgi:hypothetical protein
MRRNDTQFKALVARLQAGELTRQQAADLHGVKYETLCQWLRRSKVDLIPREDKGLTGYAVELKKRLADPDIKAALDSAVARVLAGEISALAASREDPRINHRTLAVYVRKAKLAQGLPVQHRASPTK